MSIYIKLLSQNKKLEEARHSPGFFFIMRYLMHFFQAYTTTNYCPIEIINICVILYGMKEKANNLPSLPGVYLFKNQEHTVIYIGKAKSLKDRVKSYFNKYRDWKVVALLEEASDFDYILTNTEIEAMLLEAQLIGEHKPKFNVLLKSGQPFVYLMFSHQDLPELKVVRNKKEKGTYFGPFLHKRQARSVAKFLIETFKLNICNKKIANGCLDYHIGICAGSCKDTFDHDEYLFRVDLAQNALRKNHTQFLKALKDRIQQESAGLHFEKAKHLHTFVTNLDTIFHTLHVKYSDEKFSSDVFIAMHQLKALPDRTALAYDLQQFLQTDKPIVTIDCFDISHFQSSYIVGSCVRFSNGLPDKHNFRKFKIRTISVQNDYAALQEIVARRYRDEKNLPDVILIDGGKGQLHAIEALLHDKTTIASLAKREELLYSKAHPQGVQLTLQTSIGKTLIALRDYAHHFAISYHKLRRTKDISIT